ncbi:MAG: hypothetical protein FJW31_17995 [Acidobacteria bacterium]|nr:hypothetical protein [Acidobacteriota bacterium]
MIQRDDAALADLDTRLKTILPEEYQECYENVQPVSMGSAGLKFDAAGRVAWDQIWGSFCDLAMAGGPPHRGTLLEPATPAQIDAEPRQYKTVVDEICRGIRMVSEVAVGRSPEPGSVQVFCAAPGMAGWLVRAIAMENVSAYVTADVIRLPAGPHFRLEKEIKNVVTSVAKTTHYYLGHIGKAQRRAIGQQFDRAETVAPLLQPGLPGAASTSELRAKAGAAVAEETGLQPGGAVYQGWLGFDCRNVAAAIWMMRALVVNNVVARREETILYVPANPVLDPRGERVVRAVAEVYKLAQMKQIA